MQPPEGFRENALMHARNLRDADCGVPGGEMPTLRDKVVLITGASSGFGAAAAKLFAQEGCKVALAARRMERLEELASEIRAAGGDALPVTVDVTQPAQ